MAKKTSEKVKLYTLLGLLAIVAMTAVYQFFFSAPAPRPTLQSGKGGSTANTRSGATIQTPENAENVAKQPGTSSKANQQEMIRLLLDDVEPLKVKYMVPVKSAVVSWRGNIFNYWIPPPPPPEEVKPPPPPSAICCPR